MSAPAARTTGARGTRQNHQGERLERAWRLLLRKRNARVSQKVARKERAWAKLYPQMRTIASGDASALGQRQTPNGKLQTPRRPRRRLPVELPRREFTAQRRDIPHEH